MNAAVKITQVMDSQALDAATVGSDCGDYGRVAEAIRFLKDNWREQPSLGELAEHLGVSSFHLQKLFTRWAGISPKQFVQALTLNHARTLLRDSASVLDTAYDAGLSGPGRLHDLFVSFEAMTPGDYKSGGASLEIAYGFHRSPFGTALVMATDRGLCGMAFTDEDDIDGREAFEDMAARWPNARYVHDEKRTAPYAGRSFDPAGWTADAPLKLVLIGTDFDVKVWEALLKIPMGRAVSYGDIAEHLGKPNAARAVGSAVGRNPISFVVPCHRVLRKSGALGGYHWGLTRKQAIIGWEFGQVHG